MPALSRAMSRRAQLVGRGHDAARVADDHVLSVLVLDPHIAVEAHAFRDVFAARHRTLGHAEIGDKDRAPERELTLSALDPAVLEAKTQLLEDQRRHLWADRDRRRQS